MTDSPTPADILLVEDTPSLRAIYEAHLRARGFNVITASNGAEGLARFRTHTAQVVLLDLMLPDYDGIDLITEMLSIRPCAAIVVITADRSTDRAVEAIRAGARDFLVKPVSEERLMAAIQSARAAAALAEPPNSEMAQAPLGDFVGQSRAMREVYARIRSAARSMAPVFITGENGTGKTLCAQTIHMLSARATAAFVTLDCRAIQPEHFDSEVFGHMRGAFPGAVTDKQGAACAADGGTLLLDDICELDQRQQPKLLRLMETAQCRPLGAAEPMSVALRMISTCPADPAQVIDLGRLRGDLFYRLHVVPIHMPALREHPEDIPALAQSALRRYAAIEGRSFTRIAPQAEALLRTHDWPGNVRQLMNVLRSVVVMHDGPEVTESMLPGDLGAAASEAVQADTPQASFAGHSLAEIERRAIEAALARHDGSVPRAARELDVAPSTLYRKLDAWKKTTDPDT